MPQIFPARLGNITQPSSCQGKTPKSNKHANRDSTAHLHSMESSRNTFAYRPLDVEKREIRLVILAPASSFEDDIHCTLQHVSLDEDPQYEALSYTWGDENVTDEIFLNSQSFQVTTNLVSFLRHLRLASQPRTLWADAIAINQRDMKERGHQVAYMGEVYKSAQCDLLWLGPEARGSSEALRLLDDLSSQSSRTAVWSRLKQLDKVDLRRLSKIFIQQPVLTRIWIIQELILAKNIRLFYGRRSLPWTTAQHIAIEYWHRFSLSNFSFFRDEIGHLGNMLSISLERSPPSTEEKDLLDTWVTFSECRCKDNRDKVYGILNLANNLNIQPDYEISPEVLFGLVTRAHLSLRQDVDILRFCQRSHRPEDTHPSNMDTMHILPSWVPDFGSGLSDSVFATQEANIQFTRAPWSDISQQDLNEAGSPQTLKLRGLILDIIPKVDLGCQMREKLFTGRQALVSALREGYSYLERSRIPGARYFNGDDFHEAYWRTLVSDRFREGRGMAHERINDKSYFWRECLESLLSDVQVEEQSHADQLKDWLVFCATGSIFCLTKKDYMALVPKNAESGDLICALYGGRLHYVLRPVSGDPDSEMVRVIGAAYVHGLMDGKVIQLRDEGVLKERVFTLV